MMAILLVPFATLGGRPKKISMGSVSKEPPPATILMPPAIKPIITNKTRSKEKSIRFDILMVKVHFI